METTETTQEPRKIGWLYVKSEYLVPGQEEDDGYDDRDSKKRKRGQNQNRKRPVVRESINLCPAYARGEKCPYGDTCKFSHSLEEYMNQKDEDIGDVCPVFEAIGKCPDGFRCRWLGAHVRKTDSGKPGSVDGWELVVDEEKASKIPYEELNRITSDQLYKLRKGMVELPLSEEYLKKLETPDQSNVTNGADTTSSTNESQNGRQTNGVNHANDELNAHRATFTDAPIRPTEKRRINWSGLHVLAPLTTLGNPPFRRLCRSYGAQLAYSEMALAQTLLDAKKSEWALPRVHPTESQTHSGPPNSYYGIQIAGGKVPSVVKCAELLTNLCGDGIDTIDLNCGCPLDMVFKAGAGSALLDSHGRLLKILRGMVQVTGEIPVTCKIRMGISNGKNTAEKLLKRLVAENVGVSAVTLHGRSRAQRYSRAADWSYIAECAALIKRTKEEMALNTDASHQSLEYGEAQRMAFIGNGDVNSYIDFYKAIDVSGADTSMIARGAIIKPWIFEEIQQRQHLDKSATERLDMLRQFAHWGLEHWGSDTIGVSTTRRFFCEFMSFFYRYVPLGILDHQSIPAHLHDRAPKWCGRSDLETLLGSRDAKDWVKISEMFLGKTPEGWDFTPKHKSNSVDAEG